MLVPHGSAFLDGATGQTPDHAPCNLNHTSGLVWLGSRWYGEHRAASVWDGMARYGKGYAALAGIGQVWVG